jgi:short-subunit dehydrogenase
MGASLIITARDETRGKKCVTELISESGNRDIRYLFLDLCDFQSIERAAEKVLKEEPRLDILLNNAGLGSVSSSVMTKDGNEVM